MISILQGRVTRIMKRLGGFGRVNLDTASAGDIVSIAGIGGASVTVRGAARRSVSPDGLAGAGEILAWQSCGGADCQCLCCAHTQDTLCSPEVEAPLPTEAIDPPTLTMTFGVRACWRDSVPFFSCGSSCTAKRTGFSAAFEDFHLAFPPLATGERLASGGP